MLPRTVASFYGPTVPRPYVVRDTHGEVKQDRVGGKPRVNAALVGACLSGACAPAGWLVWLSTPLARLLR